MTSRGQLRFHPGGECAEEHGRLTAPKTFEAKDLVRTGLALT